MSFDICPKCGYKENVLDQSVYWQRNPRYKGYKLGYSMTSMQQYGCYLMCLSYVTGLDPIDVDKLFMEKGVYNGDLIMPKAFDVLGLKNYQKVTDIERMPTQELSIKEVLLGRSQHFVVRIFRDNKRWIFDPWDGKELPINHYPFRSYRVFDK